MSLLAKTSATAPNTEGLLLAMTAEKKLEKKILVSAVNVVLIEAKLFVVICKFCQFTNFTEEEITPVVSPTIYTQSIKPFFSDPGNLLILLSLKSQFNAIFPASRLIRSSTKPSTPSFSFPLLKRPQDITTESQIERSTRA